MIIQNKLMRGLPNIGGSSCYLNSVLQIIFNSPLLAASLMTELPQESDTVAQKFHQLIKSYHQGTDSELATLLAQFNKIFSKHFSIFSSGQNDQHEYLIHLLNTLHDNYAVRSEFKILGTAKTFVDELEKTALEKLRLDALSARFINIRDTPNIAYVSPVSRNFMGQIHHRTECVNCGYISHQFEAFKQLLISINNPDKTHITLEDCLQEHVALTQISEDMDDLYECDKCKVKNRSRRRSTLWRLPDILCICLRRHIYHKGRTYKDQRVVVASDSLDMSKYTTIALPGSTYQLHSVANHEGAPHFGHCYSIIKFKGDWVVLNDERVSKMDPANVISSGNYMFFYVRNKIDRA